MQLNHKTLGEGKPLIILHGLLGSLDNWMTLGKKYAETYQVFLIDQRNHGKSSWSDSWNYEVMSDDLLEFIQSKNLEKVNLIGHSMGGKTVMFFASKHPQLIDRLIVADIAPKAYPVHHDQILHAMDIIDIQQESSRTNVDKALEQYISDFGTRQFLLKNLQRKGQSGFSWKVNLDVIKSKIENVGEALPESAIFGGETLFIRGDQSDYILDSDRSLIQKHFPSSRLTTLKNAGHWLHAQQPQAFFETTLAFLNYHL